MFIRRWKVMSSPTPLHTHTQIFLTRNICPPDLASSAHWLYEKAKEDCFMEKSK